MKIDRFKDFTGKYEENESPSERLRNKLTPLFTLTEICNQMDFDNPNPKMMDILKSCTEVAADNLQDIKKYLSDVEVMQSKLSI